MSSRPSSRRSIYGATLCLMGLLFAIVLWQFSSPELQVEGSIPQVKEKPFQSQTFYSPPDVDMNAAGVDGGKTGKVKLESPETPQAAEPMQSETSQPVLSPAPPPPPPSTEQSAEIPHSPAVPMSSPKSSTGEDSWSSGKLHTAVLEKAKRMKRMDIESQCQKALALDEAGKKDPFGPPLWKKILIEHHKSPGGDCRDGKGCDAFVAQGLQDVFLYTVLWRHLKRPGVYIDLAANHWKYISNTFFADHCLKWDGICIEANPKYYTELDKKRRCVVEKTCVAEKVKEVTFNLEGVFGGIVGAMKDDSKKKRVSSGVHSKMTCQPLSQIFARYDVRHVDYMNLDVEGVELQCLQGIDWDAVTIDVIGIEHNPKFDVLREFLVAHGFVQTVQVWHDVIFVHKSAADILKIVEEFRKGECQRINAELLPIQKKNVIPRGC